MWCGTVMRLMEGYQANRSIGGRPLKTAVKVLVGVSAVFIAAFATQADDIGQGVGDDE
jgi:hypothetical protein